MSPEGAPVLRVNPGGVVNQWLVAAEDGWYLIDAGFPQTTAFLRRQLRRRGVAPSALKGVLLTHGHIDHVGAAPWLQKAGVPVICGEREEAFLRGAREYRYGPRYDRLVRFLEKRVGSVRIVPDRVVKEGEKIAGLEVLETPGHTPGHIAYWQEQSRRLFSGDLILGHLWRFWGPSPMFTPDYNEALASMRRLLAREPLQVCPGHGATLDRNALPASQDPAGKGR